MTLAPTLQKHLDQNVTYEVITHDPTMSSTRTAQACHVSGDCLAKAIVLRRDGGYILAVLPASHHLRLVDLRQQIGADVALADEQGGHEEQALVAAAHRHGGRTDPADRPRMRRRPFDLHVPGATIGRDVHDGCVRSHFGLRGSIATWIVT